MLEVEAVSCEKTRPRYFDLVVDKQFGLANRFASVAGFRHDVIVLQGHRPAPISVAAVRRGPAPARDMHRSAGDELSDEDVEGDERHEEDHRDSHAIWPRQRFSDRAPTDFPR